MKKPIFRERNQYGWYVGVETGGSINNYCVELSYGYGSQYGGRHNTRVISFKRFMLLWLYQTFIVVFMPKKFEEMTRLYGERKHLKLKYWIDRILPD